MGLSSHVFDEMFDDVIYFAVWSLVALIGLIRLVTENYPRPPRPSRIAHQIAGGALLLLGLIAAAPYAPTIVGILKVLLTPEPRARELVLAQDQTIAGIAFQSGSIVTVMPDGLLVSAELKRPHTIDGLTVTGHVEFWRVNAEGGTYELSRATLAADQEIPNSAGAWCSTNQPISMDTNRRRLSECELARALKRDNVEIPAGSHIKYDTSYWVVDLPSGGKPVSIDGLSVPGGWTMEIWFDPAIHLSSLSPRIDPTPETQLWVEIHGIRLMGSIRFPERGSLVEGELWQDATIEGTAHKKGESVRFRR